MKLKGISILFCLSAIIIALTACSKKQSKEAPLILSSRDLLDYYIVALSTSGNLAVLYFSEQENGIEMVRDTRSSRRHRTMGTMDSKGNYTFDVDNNGANVYTFRFQKNPDGSVALSESSYKTEQSGDNSLAYIRFERVSTMHNFINSNYIFHESISPMWDYINFISPDVMRIRYNTAPTHTDYVVDELLGSSGKSIGWKTKIENHDYMGVVVNEWMGEKRPFMLMQNTQNAIVWPFVRQ